jgi:hypothetical protein
MLDPSFGSYCEVAARSMTNGIDARTRTCIYLNSRLNGTGTHTFLTLDTQQVISANHCVVLPITDLVIQTINGWAAKNKNQTSTEPTFTFHERGITHDAPDDEFGPMTAAALPLHSCHCHRYSDLLWTRLLHWLPLLGSWSRRRLGV